MGSIPLGSFSLLRQMVSLFWVKASLLRSHLTSLSLKRSKSPLILCLYSLACIRWFPLTILQFLVKMLSQQNIFLKVVSARYRIWVIFPLQQTTILHLIGRGLYYFAWLGCRRAKPKPYLTHLPFYFCLLSDFGIFLLHAFLAAVALFPSTFVIAFDLAFLSFMQFLLLILFVISCFFPSRLLLEICLASLLLL